MTIGLKSLYAVILVAIIGVNVWALANEPFLLGCSRIWQDPWARATLFDCYFSFTTIFLWIAYRENRWWSTLLWFVLVMGLGNAVIAPYLLYRLFQLKKGQTLKDLLVREGK